MLSDYSRYSQFSRRIALCLAFRSFLKACFCLLTSFVGPDFFFLTNALAWLFKMTLVPFIESEKVFPKNVFLSVIFDYDVILRENSLLAIIPVKDSQEK